MLQNDILFYILLYYSHNYLHASQHKMIHRSENITRNDRANLVNCNSTKWEKL